VTSPSGKVFTPPLGRYWTVSEENFKKLDIDRRVWWGKGGGNAPRKKIFLTEVKQGVVPGTIWFHEEVGTNSEAKEELRSILHDATEMFITPKPSSLIERILQISTCDGDLILDSFAGSGTTGHAVLKMNRSVPDKGHRRFILIEMDDNIARNVTAERVRRVSQGYTNSKSERIEGLGGGFQFCKLSNVPLFTPDGQIRADVTFAQLAEFVWFVETGTGFTGKADSPLIGVHEGRAVYLLYNGILKDRTVAGGNILTGPVYDTLPKFEGPKVIYAAAYRLGAARLAREGIVFKQTPYALEV
jgi:site-specific DNA-methyltransferase (adenine-specific)/adenine-specific DNA-methyltransferase